jgi:2-dehydropantoate 2-reductase
MDHIGAVRENGLHIEGIWGQHHVRQLHAVRSADELSGQAFDLIVLTVKAYDTLAAVDAIRPLSPMKARVLSVQNGYGNTQALQRAFGHDRVLGARIITGVELASPGRVIVTVSADDIRLGPPAGELELMPAAREIAQMFCAAGIPATETDRYADYLWAKILYNCALNPLGALLRATYGQLAEHPGTRSAIDCVIDEAFAVARSCGVRLFWNDSSDYRRHFYDELIPPTAQHYPSMLRDLEKRGRTEIDALNGAVVQLGVQAGIDVPVNKLLATMIKLRERTRLEELRNTGT